MNKTSEQGSAADRRGTSSVLRRPARLGDEAYGAIFERIMSLEIPPGARITVDGMARELGVSQTPIREALARLESEGLVNKQHLIGYSAAPQMSRKQFYDTYELRLLLEPATAAKAARVITDEALTELENLAAEMGDLDKSDKPQAYARFAQLDTNFHDQIAKIAGNTLVVEALERLHTQVHLFRLLFHSRVTAEALGEHRHILEALRHRDPAATEAAMRDHVLRSQDRFKAQYPA
ncbi:MAG TPA: GntR family transcriptional regulator [Devosiaceae bacterium]|jgi:DNA-binding GntR family transcriptional regulator